MNPTAATLPSPPDDALRAIRMLLCDVDGVLTDGTIQFDGNGVELKTFHVHDAAGIVYWNRAGGLSGFLSGRDSPIARQRAAELGVHEPVFGRLDKAEAFAEILARQDLAAHEVAYVGDDLLDLPVLRQAGFAVTVPNGRAELRSRVHHVTALPGGRGAVREVVEILLRARGVWQAIVDGGGRA